MGHSLVHLNSALMCAVDIFTTGTDPRRDSLIGFCVLPLNSFYEVYKQDFTDIQELKRSIVPFDIELIPNRKEYICQNIREKSWVKTLPRGVNRSRIVHATTHGIDHFKGADYFDKWFQELKMPWRKKLCVISHNWIEKRPFVIDWLGEETYNQFFDIRYRDVVTASIFANDRADVRNVEVPWPKNFITYLCSQLKIEYTRKQDLISNCVCLAQIYKGLITHSEVPF